MIGREVEDRNPSQDVRPVRADQLVDRDRLSATDRGLLDAFLAADASAGKPA